ncbi:vacuolar protein sorting-associated protein 18 dor [Oratosquilla oratoria]|uniref:vacuolar protein sorting-associated protein 18 dor n=1 Tax=Oratosquilla oratoria TaxID=337810 RepID=UPI003F76752D
MASIFDQYESQQQSSGPTSLSQSILGTTTFMNLKLEDESAIFSKLRVSYPPPHPVTHLVVSNNHLVLAMANKELIKIDLQQPNLLEEVDLSKLALQAKIHKVFLDPTGQHILVSISSKDGSTAVDTIYLPWSNGKPKSTSKLKGYLVTAVAWNRRNHSENLTGSILVGTSRGVILEMELTSDEKMFQSGHEQYCKVMFDLGKEGPVAITALDVHCCPNNDQLYLILAATIDKLYQFSGHTRGTEEKPLFATIFNNYLALPLKPVDLPSNWKSSVLQLYSVPNTLTAKHFAWMTEQGVYTAEISWPLSSQDDMTVNRKLHTYPENCDASSPPCGMIVTEFHVLIVWPDKVCGICFLNNQVVFEDRIPEDCGCLVGITKDTVKGTIWVFAERGVFKYKVDREGRNVWRIHLEQGNYELAEKHCSGDLSNLSIVHLQEAQDLFQKTHYIKSAKLFAKTFSSFEEVSLKFVKVGEEEALKIYLLEKLTGLKVSEQTQVTLIVMWLIELYLKKLGNLRDAGQRNSADYHNCDEEFKSFLKDPKVKQCISNNAGSVYGLLASHDDQDNFVSIAVMLKDFDRVINQLINHGRHIEALDILNTQGSEQLFYQHIPTLLQAIPRPTVDALIGQGKRLSCVRLLPSLVHAHTTHGLGTEVLRYLEHCIDKLDVTDQVVHNFLITLYACLSPEKLLPYLKLQGDDGMGVSYDVKFALRECMSAGEERACVHILTTMGLYQDAVEMALKFDTALAKATANRPRHDQDLRKKLWLMIASHVVQKEQDVARAMEVLKECELIKIEDILPFFPDFVTIDQFKDAICASLQDYNQHIEDLKTEMDDASKAAENIRKDIQKFKQKFSYIHAQDKCCECNYPLLARPFYLFPCSHKFHQDCLSDAILMYLSDTKQRKISELKGRLLAMSNEDNVPDGSGWGVRDQIQMEIDSLVAGECFYCGDALVSNVDTPFIDPGEWESLMQEWQ